MRGNEDLEDRAGSVKYCQTLRTGQWALGVGLLHQHLREKDSQFNGKDFSPLTSYLVTRFC